MSLRFSLLGLLARYYSARHSRGHYRSCSVTGTYLFFCQDAERIVELIKSSLSKSIERHGVLCYGISGKSDTEEARFVRFREIKWEDVVKFQSSNAKCVDEDVTLAKELRIGHEHLFTDKLRKPAWKVIILKQNPRFPRDLRTDVLFIAHHGLADGTSCAAFHKTFFEYLRQASSQRNVQSNWPYTVPLTIAKPLFVEDALAFNVRRESISTDTSTTVEAHPFDDWTAAPPSLLSIDDYISRVYLITIPAAQVQNILKTCRRLSITFTGLLHSLVIVYLSRALDARHRFKAVTPYSMRRFTKLSDGQRRRTSSNRSHRSAKLHFQQSSLLCRKEVPQHSLSYPRSRILITSVKMR
jgi:hypothetical protein